MMEDHNIAQVRIKEFKQKFGETTLHLAYHAALSVVLNAEFVHLLRINFFLDPPETLDYTAEFDLLLSPFCHEIGDGLYEIDRQVRDELLKGLIHTYKDKRIAEIGELLRQYTYRMPWSHRPALERAQELTALDALDHQKAVQWLENAEQAAKQKAEVGREWFVAMRGKIEQKKEIERQVELSDRLFQEEQKPFEIKSTFFNWLHLSDLHCGMPGQSWRWPNVREIVLKDIERIYDKTGPWDLILFTGDLTFSGEHEEFTKVTKVLQDLWEKFKKLPFTPLLLTVPGNHDLVWQNQKHDANVRMFRHWESDEEFRREFWTTLDSPYQKVVTKAFENYTTWRDNQPYIPKNLNSGLLPGDFSFTLEKDGAKLGIVGLNTAFLQLTRGDYNGKLAMHTQQFHSACGGDGPRWIKRHHACLLITHHPPEWLNMESQQHFREEIFTHGYFAAHLCGHLHVTNYREIAEGGIDIRRRWQGRSLFGLEEYKSQDRQEERLHGYTVGRIELKGETGKLLFWPREARLQGGSQRIIVPDYSIHLPEDEHTQPREIKLLRPYDRS